MKELYEVQVRFEAVKIAGRQRAVDQGVSSVLFDAKLIEEFVKTGIVPVFETN